jgi:hypothetical protein
MKNNTIKRLFMLLIIILLSLNAFFALAQNANRLLLHIPEDWTYEKLDFPLSFAPDIHYKGFEELYFSPGMFDTLSPNYFTYLFVLSINDKINIKTKEIEDFLLKYYKGLCSGNTNVDTSKVKAKVKKYINLKSKNQCYTGQLTFFDVFCNKGQKILLNMELEVIVNKKDNKLFVIALVSPSSKQSQTWLELHQIRKKINISAFGFAQKKGELIFIKSTEKPIRYFAYLAPTIYDFDNDGLQDLIVGTFDGEFRFYKNVGTKKIPAYNNFTFIQANGKNAKIPNF